MRVSAARPGGCLVFVRGGSRGAPVKTLGYPAKGKRSRRASSAERARITRRENAGPAAVCFVRGPREVSQCPTVTVGQAVALCRGDRRATARASHLWYADTVENLEPTRLAGAGHPRRLARGYRLLTVSPRRIQPERRRELLPFLIAVSTQAFGVDTHAVWRQRLEESWFDRVDRLLLVLAGRDRVVGWTSYRSAEVAGERVLYMDTTGITPEHQRHGLIPRIQSRVVLRRLAARPLRPLHVVYRTRNPIVWRGLRRRVGAESVAPPSDGRAPAWARELAVAVDESLAEPGRLDPQTMVVRGAYAARGGAIYGEAEVPQSGDPEADRYFAQSLNRDDALLVIARTTLVGMLRSRR